MSVTFRIVRNDLFLVAISAVPLLLVWMVINGLRTGVIRGRGGPLARADHPFFFWVLIAFYVTCIGMFFYFVGGIALQAFRTVH